MMVELIKLYVTAVSLRLRKYRKRPSGDTNANLPTDHQLWTDVTRLSPRAASVASLSRPHTLKLARCVTRTKQPNFLETNKYIWKKGTYTLNTPLHNACKLTLYRKPLSYTFISPYLMKYQTCQRKLMEWNKISLL